ncbi:MAG: hypothetical protein J7J91_10735 [Deltaproteobacteria bacterium]|nr:hypothetical protein [Deltaproteobacteria bacterium]
MVWIVEKKVFHHFFDLGFETVRIPIRVKFEFEVKKGILVPGSISKSILYNLPALERHYPNLDPARLQQTIEEAADNEIQKYLQECGYLKA